MTSHTWQPILFCCPPPKRSGYGYWGDSAAIDDITPIIKPYYSQLLPPEKEAKWIIGEKDGRVFFGRRGQVGDLMGWDYPAAEDNVGRKLAFFLGYSAPSGTPLPRVGDFERIEETMKADIEKFYAELTEAYPNDDITPSPTLFDFSRSQGESASNHAWDKMASEIEGEKKSTLLVINQQGEVQTQDLTPELPARSDDRSSHTAAPEQKKNGEQPERESSHSSRGQNAGYSVTAHTPSRRDTAPAFDGSKTAILVSLCAICAGGIAALLYKLRRKNDRQKEQAEAPKAEQLALLSGQKERSSHFR